MKKAVVALVVLAALALAAYFFLPRFIEQQRQVPLPPVGESQDSGASAVSPTETEIPSVNIPAEEAAQKGQDETAVRPEQTQPEDQATSKKTPGEQEVAQKTTPEIPSNVPPERETLVLTEEETVKLEAGPVGQPEIIEEATAEAAVLEEPKPRDAPIEEDRVVTLGFIEDLAVYIVKNYHPARTGDDKSEHGTLAVSFSDLNKRYGTRPVGLRHSASGMRATRHEILGYLMHPVVLTGVYNLYATHCVDMLQWAAENTEIVLPDTEGQPQKTRLTTAETKELFHLSADTLRRIASGLTTIAGSPEIMAGTRAYLNAEVEVMDVNAVLQKALAERAGKEAVTNAGALLKESIQTREDAKNALLESIRSACGESCESLDKTQLLSMARWVHRRRPGSPTGNRVGARSVLTAADLMRDMATRLDTRADLITE